MSFDELLFSTYQRLLLRVSCALPMIQSGLLNGRLAGMDIFEMKERILLIEDADTLRDVLHSLLEQQGYSVDSFTSAEEAIPSLKKNEYRCVLSDFRLPGMDGLEFLQNVRIHSADVPFIIMTAYGSIEIAVEAMKLGANDFITKPFEPDYLCNTIEQVIKFKRIVSRAPSDDSSKRKKLLTNDPRMVQLLSQLQRASQFDSTLFITGESGTGKELLARYAHDHSPRKDKPFVAINCAAMPRELLESEFFGHEAGSFTGATQRRIGILEYASEGTVFLDEVGDMDPLLQVKLLRALQENEIVRVGGNERIRISPRIVAATNIEVDEALESGKLREDFYYRLAVISFTVPPLRERPQDLRYLFEYFLDYYSSMTGKKLPEVAAETWSFIKSYPWPGNIRELENCVERAVVLARDYIHPEHLGITPGLQLDALEDFKATLPEIVERATRKTEIEAIQRALRKADGNKTKAAKILGVSYKTLLNKVKDYSLNQKSEHTSGA